MSTFSDVCIFLSKVEDVTCSDENIRTLLSPEEISKIKLEYPLIPQEYLSYLEEVGSGSFRECQYMVYNNLMEPEFFFGEGITSKLGKKILCFGDNFSGDPAGFLPDENWKIVVIWHDDLSINYTNQTFSEFIRKAMCMGINGIDLMEEF